MIWREIRAILQSELNHIERKAIFLAAIGSMLEYYDFVIFGLMAIYISHQILAGTFIHSLAGSIIFGAFFFGYLFRPLGMKQYTDWYNHGSSQKINNRIIMLLFFATIAIGLAPQKPFVVGIITVILARSLQGFARGAEAQSEFGYLYRNLGQKRSIAVFGLIAGAECGVLFGVLINDILNLSYTPAQMNDFGWRIPFLIGGIMCGLIYSLRRLSRIKEYNQTIQPMIPFYKIFTMFRGQVLFAILLSGLRASLAWLLLLLIPFILSHKLHCSYRYIGHLMLLSTLSSIVSSFLLLRYVKTRHSRAILPPVLIINILALWLFGLSISYNHHIAASLVILGLIAGVVAVLVVRILTGFFPSSTRLSSVTLCYNFGHTIVSGGILLLIVLLTALTHSLILPDIDANTIFLYATISTFSILTVIVLFLSRKVKYFTDYMLPNKYVKT